MFFPSSRFLASNAGNVIYKSAHPSVFRFFSDGITITINLEDQRRSMLYNDFENQMLAGPKSVKRTLTVRLNENWERLIKKWQSCCCKTERAITAVTVDGFTGILRWSFMGGLNKVQLGVSRRKAGSECQSRCFMNEAINKYAFIAIS